VVWSWGLPLNQPTLLLTACWAVAALSSVPTVGGCIPHVDRSSFSSTGACAGTKEQSAPRSMRTHSVTISLGKGFGDCGHTEAHANPARSCRGGLVKLGPRCSSVYSRCMPVQARDRKTCTKDHCCA